MDEPATVRLSEESGSTLYDLLEEAGAGGMGTVFRARDRASGAIVAVKVLRAGGDAVRFALEVSALSRLSHPNIVAYVGHGLREDGAQFLAMEWLVGESLGELLERGRPPLRTVLEIARDITAGLAHAHEKGVVHRDLKPRNVFVTEGGTKILDFGVARIANDIGLTHTGQVIGTPKYMAPEQAGDAKAIGPRADLFSLGCILYRALAGAAPFDAPDVLGVLKRLATETPPRLTGVPTGVAELVAHLLEKDPEKRPRSAEDVHASLEALLRTELAVPAASAIADVERTLSSNQSTPPTHAPRSKRVPFLIALIALSIGVLAWLGYAKLRTRTAPDRAGVARACRVWTDELTRRQLANGSFTGDPKRSANGWDTGMGLAALERASSCTTVSPASLRAAEGALERQRQPGGWSGPAGQVEVPADAWAALALALHARHDASTRPTAIGARDLLVSLQRPDGAFGFRNTTDAASPYCTMVAAWALLEGERLDGAAPARAARKGAFEQLRAAFRSPGSDVRATPGFEEELLWVLAEARRVSPEERGGDDVLRAGADDVIARCALDRRTGECTRPIYGEDHAKLDPALSAAEGILVFWLPWAGATADALARSDVELTPSARADLEKIAQWVVSVFERNLDALGALPAYSLAEYVAAASSLVAAH